MKLIKLTIVLIVLNLIVTGCDSKKDYLVNIRTSFGDMKVLLYDETPVHKANFLKLAKEGKYDSTEWHRIIEDFMIQGGDIYRKEGSQEGENDRLPAEFVDKFSHVKGALAAARQGDQVNPEKMSSGCQFYIVDGKTWTREELTVDQYALSRGLSQCIQMPKYDSIYQRFVKLQQDGKSNAEINQVALEYVELVENELGISITKEYPEDRLEKYTTVGGAPHLDDEYTVFGRVVEGLDVIDKIASVQTRGERPVDPIYMTMDLEEVNKKEVTEKYGYEYPESQ